MSEQNFGIRVRQARKLAGLSQQTLADAIGVEKMTISKYETGKIYPTSAHLIALSKTLDVPVDYFFRRITVNLTAEPHCRMEKKTQKLSKKEVNMLVAQVQDGLEKRADIFDILSIREQEPISLNLRKKIDPKKFHDDIEQLALDVRNAWQLGLDPIGNLMEVTENNGFKICMVTGPDSFEAATFIDEQLGTVICIKRGVAKERQRFSLAHELGHVFIIPGKYPEEEANRFAAALLVPRDALIADVGTDRRNFEPDELMILREKYGVSIPALLVRMESLKIITPDIKNDVLRRYKASKVTKQQSVSEEPRLVKLLVMRAISEGIITMNKGKELLDDSAYCSSSTA